MDAQADPEIASTGPNSVVARFACWEPHSRDNVAGPDEASYHGELRFSGVEAYRLLDGELGPYRFVHGEFANPECFFEVHVVQHDQSKKIEREASWLPSVSQAHDPHGWFARLDAWNPTEAPAPALSHGVRHFVVVGHDSYVEVLASSYEFEQVPRVAA